jgi:hypothetical protein
MITSSDIISLKGGFKMERAVKPYQEVKELLGPATIVWEKLISHIRYYYEMDEMWVAGKPTHKNYNNLFIRRSGKSFVILGLRENYFMFCIVFGKDERVKFEEQRSMFSETIIKEYDQAEVLHDGKWLGFNIYDDTLIDDLIRLLEIKRKPNRKVLPISLDKCKTIDLGLTHQEITKILID